MAFTDIRLLRLYNNKPAKNSMSLYTDDIRGAKPHRSIHEVDPQSREKYMGLSAGSGSQPSEPVKPM